MTVKRGLGKGIDALIPDIGDDFFEQKDKVLQASIAAIKANPFQPRKSFSQEKMEELAGSIREKGLIQPLLVKKADTGYELIAGERRLRAAHMAGFSTVPVIVIDVDESSQGEIALIENIQREDLNVVEEAEAYHTLIKRFSYTQEEISRKVGKSRAAVTNTLRLLKLSESIKKDIIANRITMGHARAYLSLESKSLQEKIHRIVVKKGFSVRQTENIIKKEKPSGFKKNNKKIDSADKYQDKEIVDKLQKRFSSKINIEKKGSRGRIIIEFYSDEDFERIYDILRGYEDGKSSNQF